MTTPSFRLDGKAALLTGAARGIGRAIAEALASHGCSVLIQDIDLEAAQSAASAIRAAGGRAEAIGGDASVLEQAEVWIAAMESHFGRLDILVNNAGLQSRTHWMELTREEIERQFRANQHMPLRLCQLAVPLMRRQGGGRILNIGSIQQFRGIAKMLFYASTKAALENMTRSMARDLAIDQISVNLIAPGWMDTLRNKDNFVEPNAKEEKGKFVPMGRIGEPEDCAGAALMLCGPAAAYITGQTLYVDGGLFVK